LFDREVLIIGGGPGGYETAIRLDQYGINVAVMEMKRLGGVCLNEGCIPTKALVKSSELYSEMRTAPEFGFPEMSPSLDYKLIHARKNAIVEQLVSGVEFLFKKREIPVIAEKAVSVAPFGEGWEVKTESGTAVKARFLILATGSLPKELPGIAIDEVNVLSSTGLLALESLPKSLAVVGGGVIGCEFASILNSFGVQTQIIEFLPRIVANEDEEMRKRLTMALKKAGVKISTKVGVQKVTPQDGSCELELTDGSKLNFEKVLMSVGRAPRMELEWQQAAPEMEAGAVKIDEFMRSSLPGIYAIGDLTGKMPLAHTASKQGMIASAHIKGIIQGDQPEIPALDYIQIPRVTFTMPELASVGYTEAEAKEKFGEIKVGKFPYSANGKALAMSGTFGLVKTIARADDSKLLGMHILGLNAAELIAQGAILISLGAKAEAVESITFAHPTLSETIKESLEDLQNMSINKI